MSIVVRFLGGSIVEQIENINNVYTSEDNYIFVDKNENVYLNDVKSVQYKSIYFVLNGHLLKQNTENESFLYLNEALVKKINHSYIYNTYSEDGCFYYENLHYDPVDDKIKKDIYYHDFKNDNIKLFIKDFSGNFQLVFKSNTFFIEPNNTLTSLSLLTGESEWTLDLNGRTQVIMGKTHECKIIELLGVYKNHLVVYMEGDRLLSIDISTGQILLETFPFKGLLDVNGFQIWDFRNFKLDAITGYIYMLNKCFYYKIDIETHQSTQLKSFFTGNCFSIGRLPNITENSPRDIMIVKTVHTNDYIYFMGGYGLTTHIIGAFNRITYQIDWQEDLDLWQTDKYNNLKDIQYSNDKLYLLDTEGKLHIFEKEKVINLKESSE